MRILWYSILSFTVCLAFYVDLDRARHSVEICRAWFAAIEIYENICALWPIMGSMAAPYSMVLQTGFADVAGSSADEHKLHECANTAESHRWASVECIRIFNRVERSMDMAREEAQG